MNKPTQRQPKGDLVMRTITMPADTNPGGDIFGGWVVAQMDLGGSVLAMKLARRRVVTVAVDAMSFIFPIKVGDLMSVYAELQHKGNSSMKLHIEVWVENLSHTAICATEGVFTYVALDEHGKSMPFELNEKIGPRRIRRKKSVKNANIQVLCTFNKPRLFSSVD